jgi:transglutaminase-like putative cysteine protease
MRFRIVFAVIAIAVIGLTISGLLVVLQLLSNNKQSATDNRTPVEPLAQSVTPVSPLTPAVKTDDKNGQKTAPASASTVVTSSPAGIPAALPADACPVCQGQRNKGSGLCTICGGSGKLTGGQQISPSISPQGGLAPRIPLFKVSGANGTSLLRSVVTSSYDGISWYQDKEAQSYLYKGDKIAPPVSLFSGQSGDEINVTSLENYPAAEMALPTGLYPVSVSSSQALTYFPSEQQFTSSRGLPESYSFKKMSYSYSDSQLNKAQIDPDKKYQQLPSNVSQRIKDLAGSVTANSNGPYQKALAIQDYLEKDYQYDLDYRPAPAGREANDWFLFDEKKGVCTNFNSAFVLMARSAGIPARLVDGYKIDPQAADQVVYASQAHAWSEIKLKDLGWVPIDATGKGAGALATETNITAVDSAILKGKPFNIQGTVTSSDKSTVDGVPVELFINPRKETNGGILIGSGSLASGAFNITAEAPVEAQVGRYQLMAHCLGGIKYQDSWSDPPLIVMAATAISLDAPAKVKTSQQLLLKGVLTEDPAKPVSGQKVNIYLGSILITTLTTDENGRFEVWQSFSDSGEFTLKAVFKGSEYYLASEREIHFEVLTPTRLRLTAPLKASIKQAFTVEGLLSEEESGAAFPNQKITLIVDGVLLKEKPVTNTAGIFTFRYNFEEEGPHYFEARYEGVPYYYESQAGATIEIIPPPTQAKPNNNVWLFPVMVLAVVLIAVGAFFLWQRRKKKSSAVEPLTAEDIPETAEEPEVEEAEPEVETVAEQIILSIEFPGIVSPLPDVWGAGEELKVICRLQKADGAPMPSRQLDLLIGKNANRVSTDAGGLVTVQCTFQKKGQYQLVARYSGDTNSEPLITRRTVRIVDYREEIVDLFKSMLEWLRSKGLNLPSKATPREIKQMIFEAKWVVTPAALDNIIVCFEEADYSLHTIERKNYITMYLAQKEIRDHEPTPPAAA